MKRVREIGIILLFLIVLYTGINFIENGNLTGNVVYEPGSLDLIDSFDIPPGFNQTSDGVAMVLQENIIERNFTAYNSSGLISAFRGSSNKTSKVIADDGQEFELEKDDILNVTFADALAEGDVVTVYSDNDNDKGVQVCRGDGNCNLTIRTFNSTYEFYNFTLTAEIGDGFYIDGNKSVEIDAVFSFKKNAFFYDESNWVYPAQAEIISNKIDLPAISTLHNLMVNQNSNNQSIRYEYSTDNNTWELLTNPLEQSMEYFWVKAVFYSDGNLTSILHSLSANYSKCVSECFPSRMDINRTASISLMKDEDVELNAGFTNIVIRSGILQMNKSFTLVEYENTEKNYSGKAAGRFVDLNSDVVNASFVLKMVYMQEYVDDNKINESSIKIKYYNESLMEWQVLDSVVNETENYAEVVLEHLSTYGLFGDEVNEEVSSSGNSESSGGGSSGGGSSRGGSGGTFNQGVTSTTTTLLRVESVTSTTVIESEIPAAIEQSIEGRQESSPGLFRTMTGRVIDTGKKMINFPTMIIASFVMIMVIAYLFIRIKRIKNRSLRKK